MKATAETYREASLEHLEAASVLWGTEDYVLANYVAGLAVECILRAYATRNYPLQWDKAHHDLRLWYKDARFDLVVPDTKRELIGMARGDLQLNWNNRQRYSSLTLLKAEFKAAKLDRGMRGDFVKNLTKITLDAALEIVLLGEAQWKNSQKKLEL